MRFALMIKRFLGVGTDPSKQLGQAADLNPNTAGFGSTPIRPSDASDLVMIGRQVNASSWPLQRIAIGYHYDGAGPAPTLPNCALWIWDARSERWYQMPTLFTLTNDQVTISDVVAAMEFGPRNAATVLEPTAGSLESWLAIPGPVGAPDGTYTIVESPDLSTTP